MKKLLCVLFVASIALFCCTPLAVADDDQIELEPTLLSAADKAAYEWYNNDRTRTLFAVCATVDCILSGHDEFQSSFIEALELDKIYVSKSSGFLSVYFFSDEGSSMIVYQPSTDTLLITPLDISPNRSTAFMDAGVDEDLFTSYYRIDRDQFVDIFSELFEALDI